ncbi:MAG: LemA family protein [Candidatus Saccharibacteria bacterium]|nr:LemA family protein [Candidatus Saccharibacteria bacterium]MDB5181217.1 LemA family protein [Candidatus Saccharibacteria bacterium]
MKRKWLIPGIIIGAIVLIAAIIAGGYNGLVGQREDVNKTFANLQSQYQRRADLVPNLVSTVKGAANFEQKTLTDVTEARARATSINIDPSKATPNQIAQYQASQGELSQALGRLLAVTENYPELRAVAAFQDLQVQLEGTENRISVARNDFNGVAASYNARIQTFPTNITAGIFGFDKFPYFEADDGAENAPDVNFE